MAYKSKGKGSMNSVKGMCSYGKNPMKAPRQVPKGIGMGGNADKNKANKLMAKAYKEEDSMRGKMGM